MPRGCDHARLLEFDKTKADGFRLVFGVDEAGRGPLAGPVVAAAVYIRDVDFQTPVGDSKVLSHRQREKAFEEIKARACVGVGIVDEKVIDEINILQATHLAMTIAVKDLSTCLASGSTSQVPPTRWGAADVKVLIDGNSYKGDIPYKVECVVKGDALSLAVACASIMAKVTRDRMMEEYHKLYPEYGFLQHKGYPTSAHREAIKRFGFTPIHRKTFRVL